jgi:thiamine pyrophosphokinase
VPRAAVVFAAAECYPSARLRARLAGLETPYVVAADAGATIALAFGYQPDVVVGDLDSIDQATLAALRRLGVPLEEHPRDKDATDGQLAVERALQAHPSRLWLVGFLGGPRLDQTLANILLLTRIDTPSMLLDERNEATLVRPGNDHSWRTESSEIVSLVPLGGDVRGVRTHGLRWRLDGETLRSGDTRGVSNEPDAEHAAVSIEQGLLLLARHFRE